GHVGRNHANYVKRAAEAARDGYGNLLDQLLGEFRELTRTKPVPVASRPAYFHKMYSRVLKTRSAAAALNDSSDETVPPGANHLNDLHRQPEANQDTDPPARILDDAERRGFTIPNYIRHADVTTVNEWSATLGDRPLA